MLTILLFSSISYWLMGALAIVILITALISYHRKKFTTLVQQEMNDFMALHNDKPAALITPVSLKNLPPIVQTWLRKSGVIGKSRIQSVQLKQRGWMRTKPKGTWMPMAAEQIIVVDPPGFIWKGTIAAGYLMTILGRDKYANGKGNMLIKMLGVLPIADSNGKEIDQGALMRFLAEITWVPTAAVENFIDWESVSETTARATITDNDQRVTGLFVFNESGDLTGFEGKRYGDFGGHYSLETWSISILGYKEFDGIRVGNKCEVTWKLKDGDFTWLKVEINDLRYS